MKITLLVIGKTNKDFLEEGISMYKRRIDKYVPFTLKVIPDLKKTKHWKAAEFKHKEGEVLMKLLDSKDYVVLLDERGKTYASVEFANQLQSIMNRHLKHIVFVIGGAYGFSETVYNRANEKISLSKMTFSHQLIRLIFTEQLYRAFSILNNEPYHNE